MAKATLYVFLQLCDNLTVQISAVIITYNEQDNIVDAIRSLDWADEVLVVDSESTDDTLQLAKSAGARVLIEPWKGFGPQKQFAAESAAHDWIFSLDADERVSPRLAESVRMLLGTFGPLHDAYAISRLPIYMGREIRHGGWYPDSQVRLFDRRKARWSDDVVHESVRLTDGSRPGALAGDIIHYSVRSAAEHHRLIGERYAPLGAIKLRTRDRKPTPTSAVVRAAAAFLKGYFLKLGFLDGFPGFCIAWFAAHNVFLKHLIAMEQASNGDPDNSPIT